MGRTIFATVLIILIGAMESTSFAGSVTLRVGPPGAGDGGTNPAGLPPGPSDIELGILTDNLWETSISLVPGIFFGKRVTAGPAYVGFGGGLAISANGVGPGPYTSFGLDFGASHMIRINVEYKQALALTSNGIVSPYAVRVGLGVWY